MEDFVEDEDYAIYFVHQEDARPFNRGAIKNIGFIAMRKDSDYYAYKDIVFVFHDVDVMAYQKGLITYFVVQARDFRVSIIMVSMVYLGGIMAITGRNMSGSTALRTIFK